jgi:hypothetical protein
MRPWRRRSRTPWTDDQLVAQIRGVYIGHIDFVGDVYGPVELAAVVFHQDPDLLPRRMVRWANREQGGCVPYCTYGVQWDEHLEGDVAMGDEPTDSFLYHSGHASEAGARLAAKDWLEDVGDRPAIHVAFSDLPPFAQNMVLYMLRRGPAHFGL